PQVGVRRRGVQVVVQLLGVLAVVALGVGQAEEALLQDRIAAVPQGERQAQPLPVVTDAGQAVLPPAVGPAARVVVREVRPGAAVRAVVLAHRAPLPFAQVRPPAAPGLLAEAVLFEALPFCAAGRGHPDGPFPSAWGRRAATAPQPLMGVASRLRNPAPARRPDPAPTSRRGSSPDPSDRSPPRPSGWG